MSKNALRPSHKTLSQVGTLIVITTMAIVSTGLPAYAGETDFGPSNPFYAESSLPFHAPPFDKIKDGDYQPAIEAGMAQQREEVNKIANDPAPPTFENTIVAMEKTGRLFERALLAFNAVTGANLNPTLQKVQEIEAPKLAAHSDAIFLDGKLFQRVKAIYDKRESLKLDPEALRLVKWYYDKFVHSGANLSEADKTQLKKLNEEESSLSQAFTTKLLAATKDAALITTDKATLAGLTDAQVAAAAEAAKTRKTEGYVVPLQNTTQQPDLSVLKERATRQILFENSWNRAEKSGGNDTRDTVSRLAELRTQKAKLLGFPNYASWKLEDQMAKNPQAAIKFMDSLVPGTTAAAHNEARDIQALIDQQKGGFQLQPWDWEFYAEQVRKAKYDLDESQIKPYFELNNVLQNGVFYAATQLYGITFKERKDIPVWQEDVRVFEVTDANGKPLALWYGDYFKRDNKNGGAWMDSLVTQSKLMGTLPVVINVCNFAKPAAGEPALLNFRDVTTMFHEFGHALHGMFADTMYPTLSGTSVARDFVEFPSQFNENWATYPAVFHHYAKHCQTGEMMPQALMEKIQKSLKFNQGYAFTEIVAAAQLDMQWHILRPGTPKQNPDEFEKQALDKTNLALSYVPPRYRSSYFAHIWGGGYSAGYYAYLWAEMLDHDAFQWFEDHGGLTRANGDRFRKMVLSRGNTEELEKMYDAWRGSPPSVTPMMKFRGLVTAGTK
jgi:peptidyl-dipeptidase Dcp